MQADTLILNSTIDTTFQADWKNDALRPHLNNMWQHMFAQTPTYATSVTFLKDVSFLEEKFSKHKMHLKNSSFKIHQ